MARLLQLTVVSERWQTVSESWQDWQLLTANPQQQTANCQLFISIAATCLQPIGGLSQPAVKSQQPAASWS